MLSPSRTHRYLGSGANGCALKPAVPCGSDVSAENTVSKIFKHDWVAKDEIAIHDFVIKKVDPKGVFTLRMVNNCDVELDKFDAYELSKCDDIVYANAPNALNGVDRFHQIVYEYGGQELGHDANVRFADIFFSSWRIFDGLVLMTEAKFVHQDIKPANVLYNFSRITLIDFGLALPVGSIYNDANLNVLSYVYPYYPPEYNIYTFLIAKQKNSMVANMNALYTRLIKLHAYGYGSPDLYQMRLMSSKPPLSLGVDAVKSLIYEQVKEFNIYWTKGAFADDNIVHTEMILPSADKGWRAARFASKVDVYSFGVTLLECLFTSTDVTDLKDPFIADVYQLLKMMICFNPVKRYTPRKANARYKQIVKKWVGKGKINVNDLKSFTGLPK